MNADKTKNISFATSSLELEKEFDSFSFSRKVKLKQHVDNICAAISVPGLSLESRLYVLNQALHCQNIIPLSSVLCSFKIHCITNMEDVATPHQH